MALAAATGGELRIRDVEPARPDQRSGASSGASACDSEIEGDDMLVPPGQQLRVEADLGDAIPKIEDGPWPAFPADLTSIALALATQADGEILIFEKMFENRLFFVDKLVAMGARITLCDPHRAIVSGPSRLHGERVESPDIRAGMAMLIAALRGRRHLGDRQHPPDRPRLRADRRAPARARRPDRTGLCGGPRLAGLSRAALVRSGAMIHPIPPGTRDVLPDEMRELRRLHLRADRGLRSARLRRGRDAGDRVRRGAGPRRRPHRRLRLPLLRRERRAAGAALGHDRADRPPGRQPLRRAPSRRCGSATSPTPTARCARSAARCASSPRPGSS